MVPHDVEHFKGLSESLGQRVVRGEDVARTPAPRPNDQSSRIVNERVSSLSDNQGTFEVERLVEADVLDPAPSVLVEGIDAKTVLLGIDDPEQFLAEKDPFGGTHQALEDRLLDALAEVLAGLGHVAEATASCGCRRGYVVGDQVKHDWRSTVDEQFD
jgi:hypothetical protein